MTAGKRVSPRSKQLSGPLKLALERTTVRDLVADDAEMLGRLFSDAEVQRFTPGAPTDPDQFRRFVARARQRRHARGHLCLAIECERKAVGIIQAWPVESSAIIMEWGFALGRPYRRQGLLHEAASGFVTWAFSELGVERLEARTALCNHRATSVMLRLSARPEGILRHTVAVADNRADGVLWSILAAEWRVPTKRCELSSTGDNQPSMLVMVK